MKFLVQFCFPAMCTHCSLAITLISEFSHQRMMERTSELRDPWDPSVQNISMHFCLLDLKFSAQSMLSVPDSWLAP